MKLLSGMASAPYTPGTFREAVLLLTKRYGTGERLEDHLCRRIQRFPILKRLDSENLVELQSLLDEIYYHTRARYPWDFEQRLESWTWMALALRDKIPRHDQMAFLGELERDRRRENLLTFRDFIR